LNEAGDGLQFRGRVQPLVERLDRLYALAEKRNVPLVFTTCCSGRMLDPDSLPEVLYVPLDAAEREWEERLRAHRLFYLAKNKQYDMFRHNGNAVRLVQALGVREWVIFGNGFDMCIDCDIRALLAAGQKVCLLSDVYARSAPGYFVPTPRGRFETATPQNEARLLAEFGQLGVRIVTLEQFIESAT
jgi:nicotinamidase-related amidase